MQKGHINMKHQNTLLNKTSLDCLIAFYGSNFKLYHLSAKNKLTLST